MSSAHSFSFSFSSSFSSKDGAKFEGSRSAQHLYTDPNGRVTYKSEHKDMGRPAVVEERKFDRDGREILYDRDGRRVRQVEEGGYVSSQGRIEDVSDK